MFRSIESYYVLMFLLGLSASLNPCIGYVYLMEIVHSKHTTLVITLAQIGEGIPTLLGPCISCLGLGVGDTCHYGHMCQFRECADGAVGSGIT